MRQLSRHRVPLKIGRTWLIRMLALMPLILSCEQTNVSKPQPGIAKSKPVERVSVTSSHLKSVGYDEETRTLTIEFHNGAIYRYEGVPPEIHGELMMAKSHGVYFHRRIRDAGFKTQRVR